MARGRPDTLAGLATLADRALAAAVGPTLALWPVGSPWSLPPGAAPVEHWGADMAEGRFHRTVASVGQLADAVHLGGLLGRLARRMDDESLILFCEPTIARQAPSRRPPHDVTTTLWRNGFTVIECHRVRRRHGRRSQEYCWGRARLTPETAPRRKWALDPRSE